IDGHSCHNKLALRVCYRDLPMVRKESLIELIGVNDLKLAAAGEQGFAIRRKAQSIITLIDSHPADDFWPRSFDMYDGHSMIAIAGVQDRQPFAAGMQGHVDRKIAELDLLAGRFQRPLVGELNHSARLHARQ